MHRVVNRVTLQVSEGHSPDLAYWLAQPVQARIDALEMLRRQHANKGQPDADIRVERVCRVTQLKRG